VAHLLHQIGEHSDLQLVDGCEVGVAPLGRLCTVPGAIPDQECLSQARSGRDDRDGAARHRAAGDERMKVLGRQIGHGVGDSIQVVDQLCPSNAQGGGKVSFLHHPGQVGNLSAALDDRASNAKDSSFDGLVYFGQK